MQWAVLAQAAEVIPGVDWSSFVTALGGLGSAGLAAWIVWYDKTRTFPRIDAERAVERTAFFTALENQAVQRSVERAAHFKALEDSRISFEANLKRERELHDLDIERVIKHNEASLARIVAHCESETNRTNEMVRSLIESKWKTP